MRKMKVNIIEEINKFNLMIIDAKQRYINKEKIDDDVLEFPTELELQRYIDSCNYEKVEFVKEHCVDEENNIEELCDDDKEIIKKVKRLMKLLPKEMHRCIGCPCLEYDYPQCESCSFQDSCLSGNSPYPNECDESNCYNTFEYLKAIEF